MSKVFVADKGITGIDNPVGEGEALVCHDNISFLGDIDKDTGDVVNKKLPIYGENIAGRVLVFPTGIGSTVGSYVIYNLKINGVAPAAIIMKDADTVVLAGAVLANIPLVQFSSRNIFAEIKTGDRLRVNSKECEVIWLE